MKRIVVVSEVSTSARNPEVLQALQGRGYDVYNAGMSSPDDPRSLSYLHTGLIAALVLNGGLADMVIGGCGTGAGFAIAAMQYPQVMCGLLYEPLDAFLFTRINAGNCISLALNKGWGWGADQSLRMILDALFSGVQGEGYPPHRAAPQAKSRELLSQISRDTHKPMAEILEGLNPDLVRETLLFPAVEKLMTTGSWSDEGLKATVLRLLACYKGDDRSEDI